MVAPTGGWFQKEKVIKKHVLRNLRIAVVIIPVECVLPAWVSSRILALQLWGEVRCGGILSAGTSPGGIRRWLG